MFVVCHHARERRADGCDFAMKHVKPSASIATERREAIASWRKAPNRVGSRPGWNCRNRNSIRKKKKPKTSNGLMCNFSKGSVAKPDLGQGKMSAKLTASQKRRKRYKNKKRSRCGRSVTAGSSSSFKKKVQSAANASNNKKKSCVSKDNHGYSDQGTHGRTSNLSKSGKSYSVPDLPNLSEKDNAHNYSRSAASVAKQSLHDYRKGKYTKKSFCQNTKKSSNDGRIAGKSEETENLARISNTYKPPNETNSTKESFKSLPGAQHPSWFGWSAFYKSWGGGSKTFNSSKDSPKSDVPKESPRVFQKSTAMFLNINSESRCLPIVAQNFKSMAPEKVNSCSVDSAHALTTAADANRTSTGINIDSRKPSASGPNEDSFSLKPQERKTSKNCTKSIAETSESSQALENNDVHSEMVLPGQTTISFKKAITKRIFVTHSQVAVSNREAEYNDVRANKEQESGITSGQSIPEKELPKQKKSKKVVGRLEASESRNEHASSSVQSEVSLNKRLSEEQPRAPKSTEKKTVVSSEIEDETHSEVMLSLETPMLNPKASVKAKKEKATTNSLYSSCGQESAEFGESYEAKGSGKHSSATKRNSVSESSKDEVKTRKEKMPLSNELESRSDKEPSESPDSESLMEEPMLSKISTKTSANESLSTMSKRKQKLTLVTLIEKAKNRKSPNGGGGGGGVESSSEGESSDVGEVTVVQKLVIGKRKLSLSTNLKWESESSEASDTDVEPTAQEFDTAEKQGMSRRSNPVFESAKNTVSTVELQSDHLDSDAPDTDKLTIAKSKTQGKKLSRMTTKIASEVPMEAVPIQSAGTNKVKTSETLSAKSERPVSKSRRSKETINMETVGRDASPEPDKEPKEENVISSPGKKPTNKITETMSTSNDHKETASKAVEKEASNSKASPEPVAIDEDPVPPLKKPRLDTSRKYPTVDKASDAKIAASAKAETKATKSAVKSNDRKSLKNDAMSREASFKIKTNKEQRSDVGKMRPVAKKGKSEATVVAIKTEVTEPINEDLEGSKSEISEKTAIKTTSNRGAGSKKSAAKTVKPEPTESTVENTTVAKSRKVYACTYKECPYKGIKSNLKRHVDIIHLELKEHACDQCEYTTSTKSQLERHMAARHRWTRDEANVSIPEVMILDEDRLNCAYICRKCIFTAPTKIELARHKGVFHEKENPFKCERVGCDHKARSRFYLKQHEEAFHQKMIRFSCSLCGFGTYYDRSYAAHMIGHTLEKPHKCEVCPSSFATKWRLDRHMTGVHSEEKEFKCTFCKFETSLIYKLRDHVIIHGQKIE